MVLDKEDVNVVQKNLNTIEWRCEWRGTEEQSRGVGGRDNLMQDFEGRVN